MKLLFDDTRQFLAANGHEVDYRDDPQQFAVYQWQSDQTRREDFAIINNRDVLKLVEQLASAFKIPTPTVNFRHWEIAVSGYETDDNSIHISGGVANRYLVVHEMAHAVTHHEHGLTVQGHGPEFVRNLIRLMAWDERYDESVLIRSAREARLMP